MKNFFIIQFASLFILISSNAFSQSWNTTGNSGTIPGTNFIGTTDAKDFVFKTNNTEKGRVKSNGSWQFGASGNLAKFDSSGNLSFAGNAAYKVAGNKYAFQYAGNPNYGLFFNSTNLLYEFRTSTALSVFSIGANSGNGIFKGSLKVGAYTFPSTDGTNGQVLKTNGAGVLTWSSDNSGVGTSQWTTNGSSIYYNNGNVGIGIDTPQSKLDIRVAYNTNDGIKIGLNGSPDEGFDLFYNNYNATTTYFDSRWNDDNSLMLFRTKTAVNPVTAMAIMGNGNVGIGTTTPASLLSIGGISGTATTPTAIQMDNSYYSGAQFDKLKFYLFKDAAQTYGFGLGSSADMQYWAGSAAAGQHRFYTAQTERMRIEANGFVGIGTSAPTAKLHVVSNDGVPGVFESNQGWGAIALINATNAGGRTYGVFSTANGAGEGPGKLAFFDWTANTARMVIDQIGNVGIGTTNPASGYMLTVAGKVICTELKVQLQPFPDYVFAKDYNLKSIEEVEQHINTYNRLPGMPSACEVEEGGLSVGEMTGKVVEKVEENTLYIIQLNKKINEQDQLIKDMQAQINALKK